MREVVELVPGEVALFGYGSLLLQASMERTLQREYARRRYVCSIRGWCRTWDSLYPNDRYYFLQADGKRCYPANIVYLNIAPCEGRLNGVLYIVSEEELVGFDRREVYYSRVDITPQLTDVEVKGGRAFVYVGKPEFTLGHPATVGHAAIRRSYVDIVDRGLQELGPAFREAYLQSTGELPAGCIIDDRMD